MKQLYTLLALLRHWRSHPDAGRLLRRLEVLRQVRVIGTDAATCQVQLRTPKMPGYVTIPQVSIDAWLAAWQVHQFPHRSRDLAIRQDLTRFRAGLRVLTHLALYEPDLLDAVRERARYDEAVAVAHHWFLARGWFGRGEWRYHQFLRQIPALDVELEAQLILAGLAQWQSAGMPDDIPTDNVGRWV